MAKSNLIRTLNRVNVLECVRRAGPVSRAVVARELGLSRSTVTEIVEDLLSEGLIIEGTSGESTARGGKRPIQLEFVPSAKYAFGIDIGGTKSILLLTDLNGNVVAQKKISSHHNELDSLSHILQEADAFLSEAGIERDRIVGTGIGAPGITEYKTGVVVAAPALDWFEVNLRNAFREALKTPVFIDNDVNMAVLGEKWKGNGAQYSSVVQVSIGTGIGAGLILEGSVYRGAHNYAGEIGYFQVDPFAVRKGVIQEFGALEDKASGRGIAKVATGLLDSFPNSILRGKNVTSEDVFRAALDKDPLAVEVIDGLISHISFTITNILSLVDPDVVILGGGVAQSMLPYLQTLTSRVQDMVPIPVNIVPAQLGEDASAFGAAAAALIETENLKLHVTEKHES